MVTCYSILLIITRTLFGTAPGNIFPIDSVLWSGSVRIDEKHNDIFANFFSENDTKDVLPDSVPVEFYQAC